MGVAAKAVEFMTAIARDDSHGYDQGSRWGPDYDCSSLVITAYKKAGVPLTCIYTGNMFGDMISHGFENVTGKVNLTTGAGLQPGDVLLNVAKHTAMYIGNGQICHAASNEFGGATGGRTGDQTGGEICIRSYYNCPWDYVLRYKEAEAQAPSVTTPNPSQEIQNGIYIVQKGDSLWSIANKIYGNGLEYRRIMKDNRLSSEFIYVGQKLKVGVETETPETPTVQKPVSKEKCTPSLPVLKYGMVSMAVRKLQSMLVACGYRLDVDGDFGPDTESKVKLLQSAKGIPATGIVEARTYEALMS